LNSPAIGESGDCTHLFTCHVSIRQHASAQVSIRGDCTHLFTYDITLHSLLLSLVQKYQSTDAAAYTQSPASGSRRTRQFARFTSAKVQILTQEHIPSRRNPERGVRARPPRQTYLTGAETSALTTARREWIVAVIVAAEGPLLCCRLADCVPWTRGLRKHRSSCISMCTFVPVKQVN
jgi:hypothetical protein